MIAYCSLSYLDREFRASQIKLNSVSAISCNFTIFLHMCHCQRMIVNPYWGNGHQFVFQDCHYIGWMSVARVKSSDLIQFENYRYIRSKSKGLPFSILN